MSCGPTDSRGSASIHRCRSTAGVGPAGMTASSSPTTQSWHATGRGRSLFSAACCMAATTIALVCPFSVLQTLGRLDLLQETVFFPKNKTGQVQLGVHNLKCVYSQPKKDKMQCVFYFWTFTQKAPPSHCNSKCRNHWRSLLWSSLRPGTSPQGPLSGAHAENLSR